MARLLPPRAVRLALALTALGVAWQQYLHSRMGVREVGEPAVLTHWARDAALAVPAVLAGVSVALLLADRLLRIDPAHSAVWDRATRAAAAAVGAAAALALGVPVHEALFRSAEHVHAGAAEELPLVTHVLRDGTLTVPATLVVALAVLLPRGRIRVRMRWHTSRAAVLALLTAPLATLTPPAQAEEVTGPCPAGARAISYELSAFQNVIPVNGWGDRIADGLQYALANSDARVGKEDIVANPNLSQPIVVRANVGDCVTVQLRNDIAGRRIGLHPDGLVQFDPGTSDGARVGNNPDTTVASGEHRTYTWYADRIGEAPLVDIANLDDADPTHATVELGLYGGVVVHPRGSTWHDPRTGNDLLSGGTAVQTEVFADVRLPRGGGYRSFAMIFMDENENIVDRDGNTPTMPDTGLEDSTFGINYRSEPLRNRLRAIEEYRNGKSITLPNGRVYDPGLLDPGDPTVNAEHHFCDGYVPELKRFVEDPGARCMSEESQLQSWVFGDEGKLTRVVDGRVITDSDNLIPKAYRGDDVRFHVIHPGAKETHPWHQHTQRWRTDPDAADAEDSPRKDVQSVSPGEAFPLEIEGGAGGEQGTVGDSIFHCHLYPHFAGGFWGHLRIYDRLRDGTQSYPDGTPLQPLTPLPGRTPPAADAAHPGFPLFVKGDVGQRAYRPPFAVVKDDFAAIRRPGDTIRGPETGDVGTFPESANLPALSKDKPGAGVIDPCPSKAPERVYRPHAVDQKIVYNKAQWADRQGRLYVEEGRVAAVTSGREPPDPYTIRARQGDCIKILLSNDLHLDDDPTVPVDHVNKLDGTYMSKADTSEISAHVHLVKFDELGSDGTAVGWNYVQAAMPGQTYGYRWYVDTALRTVFFHDHQYANLHQQKGLFAAMNVEPADATWHDPTTGKPTDGTGPVADIYSDSGPDFREFTVFHQDRIPMWKDGGSGDPIQPPDSVDDHGADQGGYALNFRNEPFQIRTTPDKPGLKGDPAYVYSSVVHGDPSTPVFRAYESDPVVIRNVDGAHEEVHTFNLHGHRWLSEPDNELSNIVDNQTLSLAEYFNYEISGGKPSKKRTSTPGTLKKASAGRENGVPQILDGGAGRPGDYLYGSTPLDDQWLGLWGIFRVPSGEVPDLKPLPDRKKPGAKGKPWPALKPGESFPTKKLKARVMCQNGSAKRSYRISAITKDIVYNTGTGEHDPAGALFVLAEDERDVRNGKRPAEPLFLRANAGDCLSVTLTNKLPRTGLPAHDGDVPLPADVAFPSGNRVSLHPSMLDYVVAEADGSAVGYNYDSTVGPGESITYSWYVPDKLTGSTVNLVDFGDRRGHRHHGLFAGLLIEPKGSTWADPGTGRPVVTGPAAVIRWTDADGKAQVYREHAISWMDGLNLRTASGEAIEPASPVDDPYDQGNRAINYRTERFAPRLADEPETAWVFSSAVHGDPATPLVQAHAGDRVRLRLLQASDRGRAHSVVVSGHSWNSQRNDPSSRRVNAEGRLLTTQARTLDVIAGAQGPAGRIAADYLIRDGGMTNQVNAGLWLLLRVLDPDAVQPGLPKM